MTALTFLKLGGSLITDKTRPYTLLPSRLDEIATAIAASWQPGSLLLGHGSGSFGHVAAHQFHTRDGVNASQLPPATYWQGFATVWQQASRLHQHVVTALQRAGLPAIGFAPSSMAYALRGEIHSWQLAPLRAALQAGLLPVVYGDVAFDQAQGGTILSTETIFAYLAGQLQPKRILLAGREPGICADYPNCQQIIPRLTPADLPHIAASLGGSHGTDVTGGMATKVQQMFALLQQQPSLQSVHIFAGHPAENIRQALNGQPPGTTLAQI